MLIEIESKLNRVHEVLLLVAIIPLAIAIVSSAACGILILQANVTEATQTVFDISATFFIVSCAVAALFVLLSLCSWILSKIAERRRKR